MQNPQLPFEKLLKDLARMQPGAIEDGLRHLEGKYNEDGLTGIDEFDTLRKVFVREGRMNAIKDIHDLFFR